MSTILWIVAGVAVLALLSGGKSRGRTGAGGPVRIDRMHAVDPDDHECSVCHARFTEDTMFCPRCGAHMPGDPIRYALSRRANIMICSRCGQTEALEDAGMREKLPLMQWKAMREIQEGKAWRG